MVGDNFICLVHHNDEFDYIEVKVLHMYESLFSQSTEDIFEEEKMLFCVCECVKTNSLYTTGIKSLHYKVTNWSRRKINKKISELLQDLIEDEEPSIEEKAYLAVLQDLSTHYTQCISLGYSKEDADLEVQELIKKKYSHLTIKFNKKNDNN